MATRKRLIVHCATTGMLALLIGLPARAARADTPANAEEAQALAQHYQAKAERGRAQAGAAYKTGEVQRAEAQEAKYSTLAENLEAQPVWTQPPSPVAEHYTEVAQHYREMAGGPAYKWRRVAEAEAEAQHAARVEAEAQPASEAPMIEVLPEPPPSPSERPACETVSKPVVIPLECAQ